MKQKYIHTLFCVILALIFFIVACSDDSIDKYDVGDGADNDSDVGADVGADVGDASGTEGGGNSDDKNSKDTGAPTNPDSQECVYPDEGTSAEPSSAQEAGETSHSSVDEGSGTDTESTSTTQAVDCSYPEVDGGSGRTDGSQGGGSSSGEGCVDPAKTSTVSRDELEDDTTSHSTADEGSAPQPEPAPEPSVDVNNCKYPDGDGGSGHTGGSQGGGSSSGEGCVDSDEPSTVSRDGQEDTTSHSTADDGSETDPAPVSGTDAVGCNYPEVDGGSGRTDGSQGEESSDGEDPVLTGAPAPKQ